MKKAILIIWVIIFASVSYGQDISDLYSSLKETVVIIKTSENVAIGHNMNLISEGIGSGVIVSETGEIITASHVVNTVDDLEVITYGGETVPAKVISSSAIADLALIKMLWVPKDLKVAKMGNSGDVKIGNQVCIIGAPYGIPFSLTSGYIGARHSSANGFVNLEFFQTDAAINQGNSGGPMFDMNGEVIGIVSSIITQSGGFEGLGFAATIDNAKNILYDERIMWLGFEGIPLNEHIARMINVPQKGGFLVQKVAFMSPTGIMGLKGGDYEATIDGQSIVLGGDVILSVNNIPFNNNENLGKIRKNLAAMDIGKTLEMEVLRGGKVIKLSTTLVK